MNWRIALVDDETIQLELLIKMLQEYEKKHDLRFQFLMFESAEAFLFHFEEDKDIDLLMLDIEMGGMNGMELAQLLREQKHDLRLIFVTGYTEYIAQGYEVSAIDYVIKPVNKKKFFQVLDRFQTIAPKKEDYFILETSGGMVRVKQEDILYFEADGHRTLINTRDEVIEVNGGIGSFEEEVGSKAFIKPHRSYLLNLFHVKKVTKKEVVLDNGRVVPLSRRKYMEMNQAFINYFKKEIDK